MKFIWKMTSTIFAMFLGLLVIAASNQASAQGGIWETKAPMSGVRWSAAGGVINGKLYVAGGGNGVNALATLEVYDPATNTWTTKAPMHTIRYGMGAAVINGKLFVVGGDFAAAQKQATLEVYDPAIDTWTTKASMPTARSNPGVVAIDGKLYVAGGCVGWCAPVTNVLQVYDPSTDTWTAKAAMPTGRGIPAVEVVDGLFYVMGGGGGYSSSPDYELMLKAIEVYNPTSNTWTTKAQHLVGGGGTAGAINGKIYVAEDTAATEVYDPATDAWAGLSPMPTARYYATGGVINGKLYVAGGAINGASGFATLEVFTPPCEGSQQPPCEACQQQLQDGLSKIQQKLAQVFRNPQFTIPGATPLEQYDSLVNAILGLNKGRLEGLYMNLGGHGGGEAGEHDEKDRKRRGGGFP